MIENLQDDELYQLENKLYQLVLERQNMKNQTIFELYTDDNKSKDSSNPKDILKSAKKL